MSAVRSASVKRSRRLMGQFLLAVLVAAACTPAGSSPTSPVSPPPPEATIAPAPTTAPTQIPASASAGKVMVAFVKDGNVHGWDSTTGESTTIFESGDVTDVAVSDDGQVIAFLRLEWFEQPELWEQFSIWAVDPSGEDLRELVSAETLRLRLNAGPTDSTGIAEVGWIPRTHRLVYCGTKYFAPGQSKPAAEDVYVVDADTLSDERIAPAGEGIRVSGIPDGPQLVPSPDGSQVALLSGSELSFVNLDGSNLRQAVLTYPSMGSGDVPFVPTGVWTEDNSAFLINAPIESNDPAGVLNFTITRVPADGSPAEPVATVVSGNPVSLTFSPDGKHAAYRSVDPQRPGPIITPLDGGVGPLAVPHDIHLDYINAHWSPSGDAYVIDQGTLLRLCPDATQGSDVCGDPLHLESIVESIQWLDGTRFLFVTRVPDTFATNGLILGTLDGMTTPIVAWSQEDISHSYAAVLLGQPGQGP